MLVLYGLRRSLSSMLDAPFSYRCLNRLKFACVAALAALVLLPGACRPAVAQPEASLAELHRSFANPPDSSRIMVRWWWFGPAATRPELTRELEQMRAAGIGGVEIANLYPLALDDPSTGFHNTAFLSPDHLEALHFAVQEARRMGLRVDVTLGSGWPLGGPHIPVTEAAGKLRVESLAVAPGATSAQAPFADEGEERITAFLVPGSASAQAVAQAVPAVGWGRGLRPGPL